MLILLKAIAQQDFEKNVPKQMSVPHNLEILGIDVHLDPIWGKGFLTPEQFLTIVFTDLSP